LRISRQLLDEVVAHARADAPNECCGMIAARDGRAVAVHRVPNKAANPKVAYLMDGQELYDAWKAIEDDDLEIGAIYHSHPRTEPTPSLTDVSLSENWPETLWVIVGLSGPKPDVRAFRIVDGAVTPAALEVEDGAPLDV
jgi:proteasome lid subunit RPN8/RPN11